MIIDLPETFRFVSNKNDYAEVKDGILHMYGNISFEKVMYNVTFALKGNNTCFYCGASVNPKKITLDHMYSRYIGGPTIPNNLVPCCPKCNQKKSNLSVEQFKFYLSLGKNDAKVYRRLTIAQQDFLKSTGDSKLPKEWIAMSNPDCFIIRIFLDSSNKESKKYKRIAEDYTHYHTIFNPVIIDRNNLVLSGATTLFFAKNEGIQEIPVIILENVVYHF